MWYLAYPISASNWPIKFCMLNRNNPHAFFKTSLIWFDFWIFKYMLKILLSIYWKMPNTISQLYKIRCHTCSRICWYNFLILFWYIAFYFVKYGIFRSSQNFNFKFNLTFTQFFPIYALYQNAWHIHADNLGCFWFTTLIQKLALDSLESQC